MERMECRDLKEFRAFKAILETLDRKESKAFKG
jgi:hypothetical protein